MARPADGAGRHDLLIGYRFGVFDERETDLFDSFLVLTHSVSGDQELNR